MIKLWSRNSRYGAVVQEVVLDPFFRCIDYVGILCILLFVTCIIFKCVRLRSYSVSRSYGIDEVV